MTTTFAKREKEKKRQEKAREKGSKRDDRKVEKANRVIDPNAEDPATAGVIPGPQPPIEW